MFSPGDDGGSLRLARGWRNCAAAGVVFCVLSLGCAGDDVREPAERPLPSGDADFRSSPRPRRYLPPPPSGAPLADSRIPTAGAGGARPDVKPPDASPTPWLAATPRSSAAFPSLEDLEGKDSDDAEILWYQATDAFDDDRLEDAARLFGQVIGLDPQRSLAYYRLALVQETLGRPDEAMAAYRGLLRNGVGARWKHLAKTRLAVLAGEFAIARMRQARNRVDRGDFVEAMELLRAAHASDLSPGTEYVLRAMYYRALRREISGRVSSTMARIPAFALGLVSVSPSGDDSRATSGMEFQRQLFTALRAAAVEGIVALPMKSSVAESLLGRDGTTAWEGFERSRAEDVAVDCVLVVGFGEQIEASLYDVARGRVLWSATYAPLGMAPADIDSAAWRLLAGDVACGGGFRSDLWGRAQETASDAYELGYRASESCYITMLLMYEDGGGRVLVPFAPGQDSFVPGDDAQSVLVEPPPSRGEVTGVVMLASHTPLPLPAHVMTGEAFGAGEMLRLADDLLRELVMRDPGRWATAFWTWRSPPGAARTSAVGPIPR